MVARVMTTDPPQTAPRATPVAIPYLGIPPVDPDLKETFEQTNIMRVTVCLRDAQARLDDALRISMRDRMLDGDYGELAIRMRDAMNFLIDAKLAAGVA